MKNSNIFTFILYLTTTVTALLTAVALREGIIFLPWSCLPLILFVLFLRFRFRPVEGAFKKLYVLALFIPLVLFPGYLHLLWLFDVDGIASGSSTAAILLIWIPAWSLVMALPIVIAGEAVRVLFFRGE